MDEEKNQNSSEQLDPDMVDGWQQEIQQLCLQSRVAYLASVGKHGPETSMAPFAIYRGRILLHLSSLAKHTANIEREANIGIMICTSEAATESPLALPRLSLQGKTTAVATEEIAAAKQAYLKNIPEAEQLFAFADFRLFQCSPSTIHWVGGFGKARKVSLEQWQSVIR